MLQKSFVSCLEVVTTMRGGAGLHILNPAHKYRLWGHSPSDYKIPRYQVLAYEIDKFMTDLLPFVK